MSKKSTDSTSQEELRVQTFNPLLAALRENDKDNLFQSNAITAFHKTGYPLFDYYFGTVANIHNELGQLVSQERRVGQSYGTFNLIIGNSGCGKGQPISTKIPAPNENHYILMKDIKVGDIIFDRDGNRTKVIGVYPQGKMDIYEVTFCDGRVAYCDKNHLWEVYTKNKKRLTKKIMNILDIKDDYARIGMSNGQVRYKYRIKLLQNFVKFPEKEVSIHPYVLGALIGNGCFTMNVTTISANDSFVPNKIADLCGYNVKRIYHSWYFYDKNDGHRIKNSELLKDYPELLKTYSREKVIPDDYIYNSYRNRIELLKGLMDTDGSIAKDKRNNHYKIFYTSCSKKLLEQILEIVYSLGWSGKIYEDPRKDKYVNGYCGNLVFRIPNKDYPLIFSIPNKLKIAEKVKDCKERMNRKYTNIVSIRLHHKEKSVCIKVDNLEEMYLTEHFIPTHNTTLAAQIGANIIRQYPFSTVVHFDCENRFDTSRCENITKLTPDYFENGRYIIKNGMIGLDEIQKTVANMWYKKMNMKDELSIKMPYTDEFGNEINILQPTIIIIDSITTVLSETYTPNTTKELNDASSMRGNTEGARDARTLKGLFKDILPMCKESNIIIYGINHINTNMSMNAFIPVARQQNFLKQDESIPGGRILTYYPHNIVKLVAKPSDNYTNDSDGFEGHTVMVEPIKSSSNQSGNNSKGISFNLVFDYQKGFDNLRSLILYGKENGIIEGNKNRLKFKDDDSFTFNWKNLPTEVNEKPIWECIKKFIIPQLDIHLPFIDFANNQFDSRSLDY